MENGGSDRDEGWELRERARERKRRAKRKRQTLAIGIAAFAALNFAVWANTWHDSRSLDVVGGLWAFALALLAVFVYPDGID
jgi:hypothetical protein